MIQTTNKTKVWLHALRLRTLPLSVSGILMGSAIAFKQGFVEWTIFFLSILTTLLFQIVSNLANDYGDGVKGTDNIDRIGPIRAIQSGVISQKSMKRAIGITAFCSLMTAGTLIYVCTHAMSKAQLIFYSVLAVVCVVAAITYTVGKKSYGYYGLGDPMVFLFFGWVSVLGVFSLYTNYIDWNNAIPATAIGLLSVAVLNLNNMRDYFSDKKVGKNTLVVKMGIDTAKLYHVALIVCALLLFVFFLMKEHRSFYFLSLIPSACVLLNHAIKVAKMRSTKDFDPQLKVVSLSTFTLSLLYFICTCI